MLHGLQIDFIINKLKKIVKTIPLFILGDLNEPSHRDIQWNYLGKKIPFPTSTKIYKFGMLDSQYYENNKKELGLTYNAKVLYKKPFNCKNIEQEKKNTKYLNLRLDYIYYNKKYIKLLDYKVIDKFNKFYCNDYPSDHFAILGKYELYPHQSNHLKNNINNKSFGYKFNIDNNITNILLFILIVLIFSSIYKPRLINK